MKKFILVIGVFTIFIGCENDLNWNFPRSNPNDLYNVCFEDKCDSQSEIFYGNWSPLSSSVAFKGGAMRSSRQPDEYIQFSHTSTSSSSLCFWIDVGIGPYHPLSELDTIDEYLTDGTLLKVYINNVELPLNFERRKRVQRGYLPMYWWKIRTDVFPAGTSTVRIEISGISNNTDRSNAIKVGIDEIEIKCR